MELVVIYIEYIKRRFYIMKRIKKAVAIVLLIASCVQCLPAQCEPAKAFGISALSENTLSAGVTFSIKNGVAKCGGYVTGKPGVSSIGGALLLKKGSTTIKVWQFVYPGSLMSVNKETTVSRGTYTLVLNVSVYLNGVPEHVRAEKTVTY